MKFRPLPPVGAKVRYLRDNVCVTPESLEGKIATVTAHYPSYDDDIADSFGLLFEVSTGYSETLKDGTVRETNKLAAHCDEDTWELL
jgi:hypothetical protein